MCIAKTYYHQHISTIITENSEKYSHILIMYSLCHFDSTRKLYSIMNVKSIFSLIRMIISISSETFWNHTKNKALQTLKSLRKRKNRITRPFFMKIDKYPSFSRLTDQRTKEIIYWTLIAKDNLNQKFQPPFFKSRRKIYVSWYRLCRNYFGVKGRLQSCEFLRIFTYTDNSKKATVKIRSNQQLRIFPLIQISLRKLHRN